MLHDRKQVGKQGQPLPGTEDQLFITGTSPKVERGRGRALGLQGERTAKFLSCTGTQRSCRGWMPGSYEVQLSGTRAGQGSRGCWAAIDCHVIGVLTRRDWRARSGGAS